MDIQHFMIWPTNTNAVCGADMIGRRNSRVDCDTEKTTCIKCKAINEGRPLYAVTFIDEDGMSDQMVFNTPKEQLDYLEEAFDNGAVQCTLQIISNEELFWEPTNV